MSDFDPAAVLQHLLGCRWGRQFTTPDDEEPCPEKAEQIIILHVGDREIETRLCAKHIERLSQETTPHDFGADR